METAHSRSFYQKPQRDRHGIVEERTDVQTGTLHTGDGCFSQTYFPSACGYWPACRWMYSIRSGSAGLRRLSWNRAVAEESSLGHVRWSEKHKTHMLLLLLPEEAALPHSKDVAAKAICAAEAWHSPVEVLWTVWTVEDCAVGSRWQASWMLTYNLCKWSRSETQSLDRSRGAKAKLGGQLVSFYKLKQSPSSYLGLEDAALYLQCTSVVMQGMRCRSPHTTPAADHHLLWQSNLGIKSVGTPGWTTTCNQGFGTSCSTRKALVIFHPSSEIGWLPPSLDTVGLQVRMLPFSVT